MKCPYCNTEMSFGYIQSRDGVYWDNNKRKIAAIPPLGCNSINLASGGGPFSGASVIAYNCENCKKIIIEYS